MKVQSTFKAFELKVLYVSRRLNIPMMEILQWTVKDLYKAIDLLGV